MKKTMIDRHYYVRSDQDENLKNLAKRLELKPAQLVRQGIDLVLQKHAASDDWLEKTRKIRGILKDDHNIEDNIINARKSMDRALDFTRQ